MGVPFDSLEDLTVFYIDQIFICTLNGSQLLTTGIPLMFFSELILGNYNHMYDYFFTFL